MFNESAADKEANNYAGKRMHGQRECFVFAGCFHHSKKCIFANFYHTLLVSLIHNNTIVFSKEVFIHSVTTSFPAQKAWRPSLDYRWWLRLFFQFFFVNVLSQYALILSELGKRIVELSIVV